MRLLGNKVLAEQLVPEEKTAAGVIIPIEQRDKLKAKVLMVGPKVKHTKVGDVVVRVPHTGTPYEHEGKDCVFFNEDEGIALYVK